MDKKEVLKKIENYKNTGFGKIVVPGSFNGQPFELVLLVRDCINDPEIIRLLAKWRKENEFWFAAIFPVSEERTKKWLEDKVINEPERLLFLIKCQGRYIGHVGLFRFNFENAACEIDNIVRGESGLPGIVFLAVEAMVKWGQEDLGLKSYELTTASDNQRALRLYERLGFVETKRSPLVWEKNSEGGQWVEPPKGYVGEIKRYDVKMILKK